MRRNILVAFSLIFILELCYSIPTHFVRYGKQTIKRYELVKKSTVTSDNNDIATAEYEEGGNDSALEDENKIDGIKDDVDKVSDSFGEILPSNGELFEGDIIMDDRLRRAVLSSKISKKSYLDKGSYDRVWPNGIVPYEIEESFLPKNRQILRKAIQQFETRTCIKFRKRTVEKAYIVFSSKKNYCSSSVGRSGKRQSIHLGMNCTALGTFEHEIMHALGFIHEHSRPDRDRHIKVHYKNIMQNKTNNFQKYSFDVIDNLGEDYNFASIMHYRNDAFTKNGEDTITSIDEPEIRFGQRQKFSVGDVHQINKLYNCVEFLNKPNYKGLYQSYEGNGGNGIRGDRYYPFLTVI